DCFLFFKATVSEAITIKNILSVYEAASGQAITFTSLNVIAVEM
ncbi:hypothetical protein A2U01_0112897, partial [Trifolium medium]|nr:hypothetical protein [Trifolium medium]